MVESLLHGSILICLLHLSREPSCRSIKASPLCRSQIPSFPAEHSPHTYVCKCAQTQICTCTLHSLSSPSFLKQIKLEIGVEIEGYNALSPSHLYLLMKLGFKNCGFFFGFCFYCFNNSFSDVHPASRVYLSVSLSFFLCVCVSLFLSGFPPRSGDRTWPCCRCVMRLAHTDL